MSELAKKLRFRDTGKVVAINRHMNASFNIEPVAANIHYETAKVFRLETIIGAKVMISDREGQSSNGAAYVKARKDLTKSIIESIYGEFRAPIYEIMDLLYEREVEKARDKLDALVVQMFEVE